MANFIFKRYQEQQFPAAVAAGNTQKITCWHKQYILSYLP